MIPAIVYLSAGSNLGDRKAHLSSGIESLRSAGMKIRKISSVYETEPWGVKEQPSFLNIVVEAETILNPEGSDLHDRLNALVHPPTERWPRP